MWENPEETQLHLHKRYTEIDQDNSCPQDFAVFEDQEEERNQNSLPLHNTILLDQSLHLYLLQVLSYLQGNYVNPAMITVWLWILTVLTLFPCRIPMVWEMIDSTGISQKLAWVAPSLLTHKLELQSFLGASSTALSHRLTISCRSFYFLVVNHSPLKSPWRKHYISSHRLWTYGLALSFAARALPAQNEFVLQPWGNLGLKWMTEIWQQEAISSFPYPNSPQVLPPSKEVKCFARFLPSRKHIAASVSFTVGFIAPKKLVVIWQNR